MKIQLEFNRVNHLNYISIQPDSNTDSNQLNQMLMEHITSDIDINFNPETNTLKLSSFSGAGDLTSDFNDIISYLSGLGFNTTYDFKENDLANVQKLFESVAFLDKSQLTSRANLLLKIDRIHKPEFSLDYVTPNPDDLITKKNQIIEQFKSFNRKISSMAKAAFRDESLLVDEVQRHIDSLAKYDNETLTTSITRKNELMKWIL